MKYRIATPIAVFGGITAFIIVFLIVPTIRDILKLNVLIREERAGLESRYARRHTVRTAIEFVDAIKRELPALRSITVPAGEEIALVSAIESVADRTGVTQEIKLTPPTESDASGANRKLGIDITVRGNALAIGRFLEELERLPPAFLDEILTINRGPQSDSPEGIATLKASVAWPEQ